MPGWIRNLLIAIVLVVLIIWVMSYTLVARPG